MVIAVSRLVVTLTVDVTRLTHYRDRDSHSSGQLSVAYRDIDIYLGKSIDSQILNYSSLPSRKRPKCGTVNAIWPRSAE